MSVNVAWIVLVETLAVGTLLGSLYAVTLRLERRVRALETIRLRCSTKDGLRFLDLSLEQLSAYLKAYDLDAGPVALGLVSLNQESAAEVHNFAEVPLHTVDEAMAEREAGEVSKLGSVGAERPPSTKPQI